MEETTTLTFCQNGQVDQVVNINTSINEILKQISEIENSESKAYEILKNITLTTADYDVMNDGNEYLNIVLPVLFKIINEVREKINQYGKKINKIHVSGTGIIINNIDMFFQDKLDDIKCDLIKPAFLNSQSLKIGIKDYIEVNSAIALALAGLNVGLTNELNFSSRTALSPASLETAALSNVRSLKETAGTKFDAVERLITRIAVVFAAFILCYGIFSNKLYKDMEKKIELTEQRIAETGKSIDRMGETKATVQYLSKEYENMTSRLNNEAININDSDFRPTELQNFLANIKTIIPREIKLVSIENTEERHFVIKARSTQYQQLGYFKALLETPTQTGSIEKPILENVKASTGVRYTDEVTGEEYILVTIEGDLS